VYALTINGRSTVVEAEGQTPLLWVIREWVGLTGTKYGCGIGVCGACTVHLGGNAVRSCQVPLERAEGFDITTIEGLSADGSHPVQRAWLTLDVAQCGYCQAGQIMTAAALLAATPHPTDNDINTVMSNLCRCGTYARIRAAIHLASSILASEEDK
jgi:isoquinoline 1-oxidoreductase alpha subunit